MGQTNFSALGLKRTGFPPDSLFSAALNTVATIDFASLADGAGATSTDITVAGAALGDFVMVSASGDTQGVRIFGWVSTANTVKVRAENETGGIVDLAEMDFTIKVLRG